MTISLVGKTLSKIASFSNLSNIISYQEPPGGAGGGFGTGAPNRSDSRFLVIRLRYQGVIRKLLVACSRSFVEAVTKG